MASQGLSPPGRCSFPKNIAALAVGAVLHFADGWIPPGSELLRGMWRSMTDATLKFYLDIYIVLG